MTTDQVLAVLELLEQILMNLPLRDTLLLAPRVCRTWRALIDSLPSLQQKL
jgi:hypothetical protein